MKDLTVVRERGHSTKELKRSFPKRANDTVQEDEGQEKKRKAKVDRENKNKKKDTLKLKENLSDRVNVHLIEEVSAAVERLVPGREEIEKLDKADKKELLDGLCQRLYFICQTVKELATALDGQSHFDTKLMLEDIRVMRKSVISASKQMLEMPLYRTISHSTNTLLQDVAILLDEEREPINEFVAGIVDTFADELDQIRKREEFDGDKLEMMLRSLRAGYRLLH